MGRKLVVCDLGSIENRVLGWLAGCDAILKVFRDGRDAYLDFAARMFNIPYAKLYADYKGENGPEAQLAAKEMRQIAKPAVLGAGYGLGPGVKRSTDCTPTWTPERPYQYEILYADDRYGNKTMTGLMGYAANMGVKLTAEQAYLAWETFRKAYPEVVELWKRYEKAAVKVLEIGNAVRVGVVIFQRKKRKDGSVILRIQLPSGRGLHYINARVEVEMVQRKSDGEEYERKKLMYDGIGHGVGQIVQGWGQVYTYGGKLTENIDQAISRDILVNGMLMADELGAEIVMHVHDEIVVESDDDPFAFGISDLKYCMETTPEWAEGLLLAAEGWEGRYYKK